MIRTIIHALNDKKIATTGLMTKYCPKYNFKDNFFEISPGKVCWNYACLTGYFFFYISVRPQKNSYASILGWRTFIIFNELLYLKFHHLLVYHLQSRSAIARGDMESARSSSSTTRQLSNISVIAGVASLLVSMLIVGLYWFIGVIPNMSSGP